MREDKIGEITHFFGKPMVAAIKVTGEGLKVGDTIHIKGKTHDFSQVIESMQIEHQNITEAKPGDNIGVKVKEKVKEGDVVFKVLPD